MDLGKIKNLVKQNGDKFIFVENGEPEIVMMSFGEYEKLARHDTHTRGYAPLADYARRPPEFSDLADNLFSETEFIGPAGIDSPGLPVRLEDIRLEDLPI